MRHLKYYLGYLLKISNEEMFVNLVQHLREFRSFKSQFGDLGMNKGEEQGI